jgi:hypothetical protein
VSLYSRGLRVGPIAPKRCDRRHKASLFEKTAPIAEGGLLVTAFALAISYNLAQHVVCFSGSPVAASVVTAYRTRKSGLTFVNRIVVRCERVTSGATMPREDAIIFSDLIGKLDVLHVHCAKCNRAGRYQVQQ